MSNLAYATPSSLAAKKSASVRPLSLLFAANFSESATSGIGNHLHSLADALRQRGHAVQILWSDSFPALRRWGKASRLAFPYAVGRWIRAEAAAGRRFDVVNVHEPAGLWCALHRAWDADFPAVVVTSHGVEQRAWNLRADQQQPSWKSSIVYPLTQLRQSNFALRHADQVAVLSSDDADFLAQTGVDSSRVHVLSNGADPGLLNLRWPLSSNPRLLFVGSWIPRKGTALLAALFHQLRNDRPALELCLAGTGLPESEVLAAFPAEDRSRIQVLPQVTRQQLSAILAQDQIFLLPSFFEGMPLSLLEAMATGLPCVATDTCGMKDVITHERSGYRLPIGEPCAWLACVRRLLESPDLRKKIGNAAREVAGERTWPAVAVEWEALFVRAAGKMRGSAAQQYDAWHNKVVSRDDLELDLKNRWHTFARNHVAPAPGLRVLDAASGRGQMSRWLAGQGASVVALDFSHAAVTVAGKRLESAGHGSAACGDVGALPFPTASFDVVVSCETLEHVPSPALCLSEFARVLRPGGRLVLTTENYLNIWGLYRAYCAARGRVFNSGDVPQPIENWMFSPWTRRAIRQAGFRIQHTDGEEHHLYLLPRTNPSDCESRWLSQVAWLRRTLRFFGRRFYVVARRNEAVTQ